MTEDDVVMIQTRGSAHGFCATYQNHVCFEYVAEPGVRADQHERTGSYGPFTGLPFGSPQIRPWLWSLVGGTRLPHPLPLGSDFRPP